MRIAQIAPLHEAVPPVPYGGAALEVRRGVGRVVSFLTEELVAMGHDVTLFASGDSRTAGTLAPAWPHALGVKPAVRDTVAPHMLLMEQVRKRAGDFDVLHFHLDYWPFSVFSRQPTPFLTTLHGRLDLPELRPLFARFPEAPLVGVSDSQCRGLPGANFVRTVHPGLPAGLLTPVPGMAPRYLAFLGCIAPESGPHRAIRIARAAGIPLKIAAKVSDANRPWFEAVIRPMIEAGDVEMVGEICDREKSAFLSGAIGLLLPVDWPVPFDLAMIEAMACGTPVLAFNRGAIAEIVDEGVTGFMVETEAAAIAAVDRLRALSRVAILQRFARRFTALRMASDYVSVYQALVAGQASVRSKARPPQPNTGSFPGTAAMLDDERPVSVSAGNLIPGRMAAIAGDGSIAASGAIAAGGGIAAGQAVQLLQANPVLG